MPLTDVDQRKDSFKEENLCIEGILQFGDLYFNGKTWVHYFTTFALPFDAEGKTGHLFNHQFKIKNNIDYTMNLKTTEGYVVKLPNDIVLNEKPKFSLLLPTITKTSHRFPFFPELFNNLQCYWLSDFDVKCEVGDLTEDTEYNTDTEYKNVINGNYVNDFDDIEFKICTWDNKATNYSSVGYTWKGEFKYLDTLYDMSNKSFRRSEELYIDKICNQYKEPPIILNVSTYNNITPYTKVSYKSQFGANTIFAIDEQSIDWSLNKNKIHLVEIR